MTYNIKLRRFEYEDAQALADFCNDEDLQRYLLLCRLPYTVDDAHAFIKYAKDCQKSGGEQCFAITLDDNVIGCISYTIQSSGGREYFKLKLLVSEFFGAPRENKVELSSSARLTVSSLLLALYMIFKWSSYR